MNNNKSFSLGRNCSSREDDDGDDDDDWRTETPLMKKSLRLTLPKLTYLNGIERLMATEHESVCHTFAATTVAS